MNAVSPSVLSSVFQRSGGQGEKTKLFGGLRKGVRTEILKAVGLRLGEEPVVSHFEDWENWCLVTTHRVIWCDSGDRHELDNDVIVEATIDRQLALRRNPRDKGELRDIKLVDKSGEAHVIKLEAGEPFSGMWNMMKYLARRNS